MAKITIELEPRLTKITDGMFPFFTKYVADTDAPRIWYYSKDEDNYYAEELGSNYMHSAYETLDELIDETDIVNNILVKEINFR